MTRQAFSLIPFSSPILPDITIKGSVLRQNNRFSIHYALTGHLEGIQWPVPALTPGRKDELWKTTCFEFFLAAKDSPQYWEFNLSPPGDWNVYHMDAYRRIGFRQEPLIQQLPFKVLRNTNNFLLSTEVDLEPILPPRQALEIGIAAVIQTLQGNESYWALAHPGPQADFHLRESFILALAG